MRLYVQEIVTQKKWRFFYGLPTNIASIRILPSGVKRRLCSQGIELVGRSEAFGSLLDYQLPFLDHVPEFDPHQAADHPCSPSLVQSGLQRESRPEIVQE